MTAQSGATAMRHMLVVGAIALASLGAARQCLAAEPPAARGGGDGAADVAAAPWIGGIAGTKLVDIDGSTITLSPSEGGLTLALVSPTGATRKSSFLFVSDSLGTISDDGDAGHVVGFFRETDTGLEAQFADGRSESLVANSQGGLSLTIRAAAGDADCRSWYPADHVFGAAERRAALAAYAARLGLGGRSGRTPRTASLCAPAIRVADRRAPALAPGPSKIGPYRIGMNSAAAETKSGTTDLTPVTVRTSQVHLVDGAAGAPLAAIPPAPVAQPAAPVSQQSPAPRSPQQANAAQPAQVALAAAMPDGRGASDCLSVESDGADLGFRNHCAYGVQFAYCLKAANDRGSACDAGAKTGAVAANGFATVLSGTNIKSADAEHDFRWVACSGANGDVVAHLDRAEPPAGRCVRTDAS